jgi:hypothetical protein
MATQTGHQIEPGQMDLSEHIKMWNGFMKFVKWSVVFNIVVLVLLAIFRT